MRGKGVSERGDAEGATCLSVFVLEHVQVGKEGEWQLERLCGGAAGTCHLAGAGGHGNARVLPAERRGERERVL